MPNNGAELMKATIAMAVKRPMLDTAGLDTVVASPHEILEGATGRPVTLTFTATRNTKGLLDGRLIVTAPPGWPVLRER